MSLLLLTPRANSGHWEGKQAGTEWQPSYKTTATSRGSPEPLAASSARPENLFHNQRGHQTAGSHAPQASDLLAWKTRNHSFFLKKNFC